MHLDSWLVWNISVGVSFGIIDAILIVAFVNWLTSEFARWRLQRFLRKHMRFPKEEN